MDLEKHKKLLLDRRSELTGHLTDLDNTLDEMPSKDWEDRASERQGDQVLETLGHVEMAELNRIDAALVRIESGTYGVCQVCGSAVLEARLELLPDTPFCKSCAP
ncbi:TraR/DksA family transcriptional regulator [uncultured Boseongicola sp.]|jgi:RNA polymerase-binding transcription factor DksA|uniref:TraR/DksA family transcriptional regulator n=1 Tax=uncultured Boseongicola sp. TaxID=1648499 RepID=UPI002615C43B|nr:TraR/DksA family transcriptional regulator [uncultured Boseongicola sp.]